jgi:hypothetical protein
MIVTIIHHVSAMKATECSTDRQGVSVFAFFLTPENLKD